MINDISYDDLNLFILVAKNRNLSITAKQLRTTHSTVSRRIKKLEESLGGHSLLSITSYSFELTAFGRSIYDLVVTHLENLNGALKNINQIRNSLNEPEGELKIQLPPVLAKGLISAKLPLFSRKYPKLNLSIIFSNNEADLVKNNIDVMLLNRIPNKTDQKIRQLYSFKVRLYCTKKYADKYGIPSLPHELESHLVIGIILDDYKK